MAQLGNDSAAGSKGGGVCAESCIIVVLPQGADEHALKERRRRMALANDLIKALKPASSKRLKLPAIPPAVWVSAAQARLVSALAQCSGAGEAGFSLAVWRVKRNRVAVLAGALTEAAGSKFLDDVIAGNGNFCAVPVPAAELLGAPAPATAPEAARLGLLPPGYVDWHYPSNVGHEMEGASEPQMPQQQHDAAQAPPGDDAMLL